MSTMQTRNGYAMTSRATPETAKQLWDEAVAAHVKPSLREIARRLGVAPSTVMRWKRNDWVGTVRRYLPPANLAVEARVSEVVEKTKQTSGKVKLDEVKEAIAALVGGKDELTARPRCLRQRRRLGRAAHRRGGKIQSPSGRIPAHTGRSKRR